MKRRLYEILVPKSIKAGLYRMYVQQFEGEEIERRKLIEESIPHPELSSIYIANLKVLVDRNSFLYLMPRDSVSAEIGFEDTGFTTRILSITKPRKLHIIDAREIGDREKLVVEREFKEELKNGQLSIIQGVPVSELEKFNDAYFDWIYIATDFSYTGTARILEVSKSKVRRGGLIAGLNYIADSWLGNVRYGVIEAVNEFCKNNSWELIYLTNESHRHLSYAIREMSRD